jgi:hypothetical protein
MDIKRTNSQFIEETTLGLYVWEMPDGRWVGDDDGNFMTIQAFKGDKVKMDMLARAVRGYGIDEGQPTFLSGRRKVTDEEFEEQQTRLKWGLVPDKYDMGVYKEDKAKGLII